MRASKSGIGLPDLPAVQVSQTALVFLLVLCIGAAAYSYYRLRGGRSLGSAIRKKLRPWREKRRGRAAAD